MRPDDRANTIQDPFNCAITTSNQYLTFRTPCILCKKSDWIFFLAESGEVRLLIIYTPFRPPLLVFIKKAIETELLSVVVLMSISQFKVALD
jgi:hypothetical protein